jgi:transcriptional regulator with XRE-family HTH domain
MSPNTHLRRERQLRGWSQAHLAQQIDVPSYYLSRWERGEVSPSPYYQHQLCELFGKSAVELGFLPSDTTPLEKNPHPHPISTQKTDLLSNELVRKPSTLLVMVVSRSWIHHRVVPLALLLLLFLGMSASTNVPLPLPPRSVGSLTFSNSGAGQENSSAGMADEMTLHIHLDRQPTGGKQYFAWLLPDQNNPEGMILPLGTLSPHGDLSYHDPAHTNMLLKHSAVLITEQRSSPAPHIPSLDRADWRSQVVIDQQDAPGTPYSLLDHFRHLFAIDPELEAAGLHGGLVAWLAHLSGQMVTLANHAQKQKMSVLHQDLLRMLEDLDGTPVVAQEVPGSSFPTNPQATIGLLTLFPDQSNPGYLQHIENHLRGIATAPGVNPQQQMLANQFVIALDGITVQWQAIRQEILQFLKDPTPLSIATLRKHVLHASEDTQRVASEMLHLLMFGVPSWEG